MSTHKAPRRGGLFGSPYRIISPLTIAFIRAPAHRHRPSDAQLTQLEEENQTLRLRLAHTSSTSSEPSRKSSFSNATSKPPNEHFPNEQPVGALSSPPSSSTGDDEWRAGSRDLAGSVESTSAYMGLTSASVLEDTPGTANSVESDAPGSSSRPIFSTNEARQRLERAAAEQREY